MIRYRFGWAIGGNNKQRILVETQRIHLAAIGSAIGLGNIWRFSWLAYRNGGGAFLVPYFIALLVIILEFILGNYFQGSTVTVFRKIRPVFELIGWFAIIDVFLIGTYYAVVLGWVLDYIGVTVQEAYQGVDTATAFNNLITSLFLVAVGFLLTWLVTWYTVFRGVGRGIEKASTIAIPLLWVLSIILVVRGVTLPGATNGNNWYLVPDWSMLTKGSVDRCLWTNTLHPKHYGCTSNSVCELHAAGIGNA